MPSMRVGDICNHHAVIIGKTDSIRTAAVLMRDHHVHYIVVVESCGGHNIPVGSLTDRDIVVDMVASNADLARLTINEVMKPVVLEASENDSIVATLKRMRHKSLQHIPVINAQKELIGVLSIDDILDMLTEQLNDIGYIFNYGQLLSRENNVVKY